MAMSTEEVKVTVYRCDARNCTVVHYSEIGELPYGFHGTVIEVDSSGGDGASWYACKREHIRSAVLESLTREYEKTH